MSSLPDTLEYILFETICVWVLSIWGGIILSLHLLISKNIALVFVEKTYLIILFILIIDMIVSVFGDDVNEGDI